MMTVHVTPVEFAALRHIAPRMEFDPGAIRAIVFILDTAAYCSGDKYDERRHLAGEPVRLVVVRKKPAPTRYIGWSDGSMTVDPPTSAGPSEPKA